MSAYIERRCPRHGEWLMDVDNPGECPECPDSSEEINRLAAENAQLRAERDALRDVFALKGVTRTPAEGVPDLTLMAEGHPLANGRRPVTGDVAWTFRVLLDDGRKLDLKLGQGDRDELRKMMLAEEMDDAADARAAGAGGEGVQ